MSREQIQDGLLLKKIGHVRGGFSRTDVIVSVVLAGVLLGLAVPAILTAREAARLNYCKNNLKTLGVAFSTYHSSHGSLPPAAVWTTRNTRTVALNISNRHDLFAMANWAQLLLPFAGEETLFQSMDPYVVSSDDANRKVRTARPAFMTCSADEFSTIVNPYIFEPVKGQRVEYARGNYAINGGSQCQRSGPGTTADPTAEAGIVEFDSIDRSFREWGNGVAGFNRSFSYADFTNGRSTLVVVDEVRAGVHAVDIRGTWALGHIGASVTWGHGANADDFGPNRQFELADDIQGCGDIHEAVGTHALMDLEMPCVPYVDTTQQATARSRHSGGANVLFADGSTKFVRNEIDPGVWHAIHSRETPEELLESNFDELIEIKDFSDSMPRPEKARSVANDVPESIENSIGMRFVKIPAGKFLMGLSDLNNDDIPPVECPTHEVAITQPFLLSVYEVTQLQYELISGRNPSWHISENPEATISIPDTTEERPATDTSNYPVEQVTWTEANDFCLNLSAASVEKAARRMYRLPTEAEWEYACRAGNTSRYNWHKHRKASDASGEAAGIHPPLPLRSVGSYPANEFGLHDMRGNVWEWCSDWFDRDYYLRSERENPLGPSNGFLKVIRGGDWTFVGKGCKISYPMAPPWKSNRFVGFRVVCEIRQK